MTSPSRFWRAVDRLYDVWVWGLPLPRLRAARRALR